MKPQSEYVDVPLNMVGSTVFGRYEKQSSEQTYNMMISDGWLVNFAGWKLAVEINNSGVGRGAYTSFRLKRLFVVIDNNIIAFDSALSFNVVGKLSTFVGDVFIAENNAGQVAFSDGLNIYIYDSTANVTTIPKIFFQPGYISFQDTRFISVDVSTGQWRLSALNDGRSWPVDAQHIGQFQTKADKAIAAVPFPGRGNLLLVFGSTVTELWTDIGSQVFPYQKSQTLNYDYGCINPASIAFNEDRVCWVGINEKSGPVIMYSLGNDAKRISTDGIDFKLASLSFPSNCYAYMFRQDGHLFYIVTWPKDRLSYAYDFNEDKFYTLCDEEMNAFIPKRVAFFNNEYYFVSINDGNLYNLSSDFTTYDYGDELFEIPRIRIPKTIYAPDDRNSQSRFIGGYVGFTIEQGQYDYNVGDTDNIPRIDMCLSKDGSVAFGSNVQLVMQHQGRRQNRAIKWKLGQANDMTFQFRLWGFQRFTVRDAVVGVKL